MQRERLYSLLILTIFLCSLISAIPSQARGEYGVDSRTVVFLINSTLYEELKLPFQMLHEKLKEEHYHIIMKNVTDENPDEIRDMLREMYANSNLKGAVLVGNIPLKRYQDDALNDTIEFPYYYMNLRGVWLDRDGDGVIDTPPADYRPDIWVGVVRSTDMDGNNASQINKYISRVISYLKGDMKAEPKSVGFLDDDFAYLTQELYLSLENLYGYAKLYPSIYPGMPERNTNKSNFLNALSQPYAYGFFVVHSNGEYYYLKVPGGWEKIYPGEIKSEILFYTDLSCYGASFKRGGIANHLIMGENARGLGVLTLTSEGGVNTLALYHRYLGKGWSFGEALKGYIEHSLKSVQYFNEHIAMLAYLGFPFLKPWKPGGYREIPPLRIEGNDELKYYVDKYGWSGDGSRENPVRIENMMIFNITAAIGIAMHNITLHVQISRCYILVSSRGLAPFPMSRGIYIENSENVSVENNTVYYGAISVRNSRNIVIEKNYVNDASSAIYARNSSWLQLRHNTIRNCMVGIHISGATVSVERDGKRSEEIRYSKNANISYNRIENFSGIFLSYVRNSSVFRNRVDFIFTGLRLWWCINNTIVENNFTLYFLKKSSSTNSGIYTLIFQSWNNSIYLNNFFYAGDLPDYIDFHALISITSDIFHPPPRSTVNHWNISSYGNYWQWWAEKNNTNDENGDGIVDYPWVMDENNTDYRPLKKPFVWEMRGKEERAGGEDFILYFLIFSLAAAILGGALIWKFRKKNGKS